MALLTDLSGSASVVTGASSGIGSGVARALARCGSHVYINYPAAPERDAALAVRESIKNQGGVADVIEADVSDESAVDAMFGVIESHHACVQILVNNAGIARSAPVQDITLEDWQMIMNVHVNGTFLCTRRALPAMLARNSGRIINTASQLAYIGAPGFAHYTAAKGAILSFTRSLARELGDKNITANCVAPGATMTAMLEDVPEEILDAIRKAIPRGKIADVDEIVDTYVFLASSGAEHFRGQCLSPNGGDCFL